jgi:hypothetical protein
MCGATFGCELLDADAATGIAIARPIAATPARVAVRMRRVVMVFLSFVGFQFGLVVVVH